MGVESDGQAVRRQLERILKSPGFVRNERLSRFLRFVVERHLEGSDHELKESSIGVETFGRRPDYDPKRDPIVRTEAARLRGRLTEYYLGQGKNDPLTIEKPRFPAALYRVAVTPRTQADAAKISPTLTRLVEEDMTLSWQNDPITHETVLQGMGDQHIDVALQRAQTKFQVGLTTHEPKIPYREGMVRNRYAGRTFIQPSSNLRQRGVTVKLSPLREQVRGRRLVVVDDSIVRGTTTRQIVAMLRGAGAREVHLRISAPPIFHPCFYGIDTAIERELIASRLGLDGIRDFVGADSLAYLSIGGVLDAIGLPRDRCCFACFDGNYPVPVPYDTRSGKLVLEQAPAAAAR